MKGKWNKMNKVLVILTNVAQYGTSAEQTGLWLAEATDFVAKVQAAGFQVDYASAKGGTVPLDPRSLKKVYRSQEVDTIYQSNDFQTRALRASLPIAKVNPKDYQGIYFTGGHGVLWDFPNNADFEAATRQIYQQGGYVMSVCHGLAGLIFQRDAKGQPLIAGKKVTGFTSAEEVLSGKLFKVPFMTERAAKKAGAHFSQRLPFTSYAVRDGRLITGQNPMSGHKVAQLFLESVGK